MLPEFFLDIVVGNRELLIEQFESFIQEFSSQRDFLIEAEMLDKEGNVVGAGKLNLPIRVDIAYLDDNSLGMMPSGKYLNFDAFSFVYEGKVFKVAPFSWDNVTISFEGELTTEMREKLKQWFFSAFQGKASEDNHAFSEAIHFMSEPEYDQNITSIEIDFGSGSPEVIESLFQVLSETSASEIHFFTDFESD